MSVRSFLLWAEYARIILIEQAARRELISYSALDAAVSVRMGELQRPNWRYTIADRLMEVVRLNKAHGEPLLTSLVVNKNTSEVSTGYPKAVLERYGYETLLPYTMHAMHEQQACFRYFAGSSLVTTDL